MLTKNIKNSLLLLISLVFWALIYIDEMYDEGPIIKFISLGLSSSNLINKTIDVLTLVALIISILIIIKQSFKLHILLIIYIILILKIFRHIDLGYTKWFTETRTILPFITFIILSIINLNQINKK